MKAHRTLFVFLATLMLSTGATATPPVANLPEGYTVSAGTSSDIDAYRSLYGYVPAEGKTADIVGVGIAGSNDRVYVWYRDGTVSSGSTSDLDRYRKPYRYSLPPGKTPSDIVGIGIAGSNDHVYTWYSDGTVSSGSSSDLDQYRAPYQYSLPLGKTPADIVGMGIAGSDDRAYVWYRDGSVSSGSTWNLEQYRRRYIYYLPKGKIPKDIVGMAVAGSDDHVYAWYRFSRPQVSLSQGKQARVKKTEHKFETIHKINTIYGNINRELRKNPSIKLSMISAEIFDGIIKLDKGKKNIDYHAVAEKKVKVVFPHATTEQIDVLTFYVLKQLHEKVKAEGVRNRRSGDQTAFYYFDQKANQIYSVLNSVLKSMKEMRSSAVRNL